MKNLGKYFSFHVYPQDYQNQQTLHNQMYFIITNCIVVARCAFKNNDKTK